MATMSLEKLRDRIAKLQAERAVVASQKRTRAEIQKAFELQLLTQVDADARNLSRQLQLALQGEAYRLELPKVIDVEAVRALIDLLPAGLPAGDRDAALQKLDAELDKLELQEESLCVLDGVERRADARPEIILSEQL